jgi:quinol monooxygenase YgiN
MAKLALYIPLHVKNGKEQEVSETLRRAVPIVSAEPGTVAWFAIQEGLSRFAIFETFDDEAGRDAHLNGPVARALMDEAKSGDLFEQAPKIHTLEIVADKVRDSQMPKDSFKSAVFIPLQAKRGKVKDVMHFMRSVLPLVNAESDSVAWFAVQERHSSFAIFAVFDDKTGRDAHFNKALATILMDNAESLFVGIPELRTLRILELNLRGVN